MNISLSAFAPEIWSRETGCVAPSRVSLLIYILRLNLVFTYYGIPPEFCSGVNYLIYAAIRHRVSPEFIRSRKDAARHRQEKREVTRLGKLLSHTEA